MSLGNEIGTSGPGSVIVAFKSSDDGTLIGFQIVTSEYTRILANWNGTFEQLEESSPNIYVLNVPTVTNGLTTAILTFEDPSVVEYFATNVDGSGKFLRMEGLETLSNCAEFNHYYFNQPNFALPPNAEDIDLNYGNTASPYLWNLPNSSIKLKMQHSNIDQFQPDFLPPSLEDLDLSYNNLQSFDSSILPSSLELLILGHNNLGTFNPSVPLPNNLSVLRLDDNPLSGFNPDIELPNSVVYLDLSTTGLTSFTPTQRLPYSITELRINNNALLTPAIDNALYLLDEGTFNEGLKTLRAAQTTGNTYSYLAIPTVDSLVSKNWNVLLPPPPVPGEWSFSFKSDSAVLNIVVQGDPTTYTINWGDGSIQTIAVPAFTPTTISHTYTSKLNEDEITVLMSSPTPAIINFGLQTNSLTTLDFLSYPASLANLFIQDNLLTAFNPTAPLPNTLDSVSLNDNPFLTTIGLPLPEGLAQFAAADCGLTSFTSNIPSTLIDLFLSANQLDEITFATASNHYWRQIILFQNSLSSEAVNSVLVYLASLDHIAGSHEVRLEGQDPPAPPDHDGISAKDYLESNAWTVLTD